MQENTQIKPDKTMVKSEYKLINHDYLDLWKFFSEDTAKIKDKLWTIASWLYALMSGLMAFMLDDKAGEFRPLMGIVGIFLSLYTCFMIYEYSIHITGGWRVTTFLVGKIDGLKHVWESRKPVFKNDKEEESETLLLKFLKAIGIKDVEENLPRFAQRLMLLAIGYGVVFVFLAVCFILKR